MFLSLSIGCNHANCGDNYASKYARVLEPKADCSNIHKDPNGGVDYAECNVPPDDRWLCVVGENFTAGCFTLSKTPVKYERVHVTPEGIGQ